MSQQRNKAEEPAPSTAIRRLENLALVFQEMLTAVVRLRTNRQAVSGAEIFRAQVRQALKTADEEAKRLNYSDADIRLAIFAVVAFLDESILNLRSPVFSDWVRKPLQEELFGRHTAGEIFFENLQQLLGRRDSPELADLLEVYFLCILLGFVGRYSISGRGELRAVMDSAADKIKRIRNSSAGLSPHWMLPEQAVSVWAADPWVRRLTIGAGACVLTALALFLVYEISLRSGISALETLAAQALR